MTYFCWWLRTKKILTIYAILTIITLLTSISNSAATNQWSITITDRAEQQTTLTYDQIITLPSTTVFAELSCYGSIVTIGQWTGAKISDILTVANANQTSGSVTFTAQDGYTIAIPMETALQSDVILAYKLGADALAETYRLVIPEANGNVWIAMITSIIVNDAGAPAVPGRSVNVFDAAQQHTPNTDVKIQSPQQTPTPVPKQNTPNPTQNTTATLATPTPTNQTTTTPNITTPQNETQASFPTESVYLAIVIVTVVIISLGLIMAKYKQGKK